MKFRFNCVDGEVRYADFHNYNRVEKLVDDIIEKKAIWLTDVENRVAIQVNKIISICEVRDE